MFETIKYPSTLLYGGICTSNYFFHTLTDTMLPHISQKGISASCYDEKRNDVYSQRKVGLECEFHRIFLPLYQD